MPEAQLVHHQVVRGGRRFPVVLLLDSVELPVNVGSLFRLADALGLAALYLCGTTPCPPDHKLHRTARGTEHGVAWRQADDALQAAQSLRTQGYRLLCLELTDQSYPLDALMLRPAEPICLILGNEATGVQDALLQLVGDSVHLPMQGDNSSMNVAMAAAIVSYQITRQWSAV